MNFVTDFIQYDFLLYALIGSILLALSAGPISPLIIAKRQAFMGSAVSHSTLLGLALSLLVFTPEQSIALFFSTLFFTLLLTSILARQSFEDKLPEESFIGIFYTVTMALGILIYSLKSDAKGDLMSFLFGNVLMLSSQDILLALIPAVLSLIVMLKLWRHWSYWAFDSEGAQVSGHPVKMWHYLFYFLQTLVIVSGLKLVGIILIQAYLLIPGHFALKVSKDLKSTYMNSILFALITSIFGLFLSNAMEWPAGATLTIVQFVALLIATLIRNTQKRNLP
ncbi:MAG: metal ABC transporter permease [Bacteriovoracaceae bacterium]